MSSATLAADQRIDATARALKAGGATATLAQLRAAVFLGLRTPRPPGGTPRPPGRTPGPPGEMAGGLAQGWRLLQPSPGVLVWKLPHGRRYLVTPGVYPT